MTISIMMAIPYKLIKRSNAILSPLAVFIILTKSKVLKGYFCYAISMHGLEPPDCVNGLQLIQIGKMTQIKLIISHF